MPQNYLIDTNIFLDSILGREKFEEADNCLTLLCEDSNLTPWMAPHGLATVYYLARREIGKVAIGLVLQQLLQNIRVAPLDEHCALRAFTYGMSDFEDALQAASAEAIGATGIVTQNTKDFKNSPIPCLTPAEFLASMADGRPE